MILCIFTVNVPCNVTHSSLMKLFYNRYKCSVLSGMYFSGASPSRGPQFESIYDSVKMRKSSFYFNQFKDVQTRKLRSENLKLEKELGKKPRLITVIKFKSY